MKKRLPLFLMALLSIACGREFPEGVVPARLAIGSGEPNALLSATCSLQRIYARVTGEGTGSPIFSFKNALADQNLYGSGTSGQDVLIADPLDILIVKGTHRRIWAFGAVYGDGLGSCESGPTKAYPVKGLSASFDVDSALKIEMGAVVAREKFQVYQNETATGALQAWAIAAKRFKIVQFDWTNNLTGVGSDSMTVEAKEVRTGTTFKSAAYITPADYNDKLTFGPLPQSWDYHFKFTFVEGGSSKCMHLYDVRLVADSVTGGHLQRESIAASFTAGAECAKAVGER